MAKIIVKLHLLTLEIKTNWIALQLKTLLDLKVGKNTGIKKTCDLDYEFQRKTYYRCIPRSSVNDGKKDCRDWSDENIVDNNCFDYEFSCAYNTTAVNKTTNMYTRCLSAEMIRDGKSDCSSNEDEQFIIKNCNHKNLFLCFDQSRCIPKNLLCDGYNNCIDRSDEIKGCNFVPNFFRTYNSEDLFVQN